MCGRYALAANAQDIALEFGIDGPPQAFLPADWNIAPTKDVFFVNADDHEGVRRHLSVGSWGLVPQWSKDAKRLASTINARVESVAEKPSFRSAFKSRRCLIPANGYYEWATESGDFAPKQPFYVYRNDGHLLAMAGLYEHWTDPTLRTTLTTTSVLTRESTGLIATIHHRMPILLPTERWAKWLSSDSLTSEQTDEYLDLLDLPQPEAGLAVRPVSTKVNSVRNNGPELLNGDKIEPETSLFTDFS